MNKVMLMALVGVVAMSLSWNSQASDHRNSQASDHSDNAVSNVDQPEVQIDSEGNIVGEYGATEVDAPNATVSGQVLRIQDFGCGSYVAVASTRCPVAANLPNCNDVPGGAYCEGDGECGTNNNLNNCNPGSWDIYIRSGW